MENHKKVYSSKFKTRYSEAYKHSIVEEYLQGNVSAKSLEKKYKLGNSRLTFWLKELGFDLKRVYSPAFTPIHMISSKPAHISTESLENESLKKQLEDAKILLEGYQRMIEIAEKEFKIPIRKKYNTK